MDAVLDVSAMSAADWPAVRDIYAEGIATGNATFALEIPDRADWDAAHLPFCRMVVRQEERVLGWAALSPVSRRAVYAGVVEVSIYVAASARGRGVGKMLLSALISASEAQGIWTLQGSVFPENAASLALHKACGFRVVGRRERIGQIRGVWRDTLLLERRSEVVGVS